MSLDDDRPISKEPKRRIYLCYSFVAFHFSSNSKSLLAVRFVQWIPVMVSYSAVKSRIFFFFFFRPTRARTWSVPCSWPDTASDNSVELCESGGDWCLGEDDVECSGKPRTAQVVGTVQSPNRTWNDRVTRNETQIDTGVSPVLAARPQRPTTVLKRQCY